MLKLHGSVLKGDRVLHGLCPEISEVFRFFGFGDVEEIDYFKVIVSRAEVVVIYSQEGEARKRAKLELLEPAKPGEDPHAEVCKFLGVRGMYVTRVTLTIQGNSFAHMDIEAEPLINNEWNSDLSVPNYKIKEA